jgi:hypothetical protein
MINGFCWQKKEAIRKLKATLPHFGAKFWFFLCCRFLGNGAMKIGTSKF